MREARWIARLHPMYESELLERRKLAFLYKNKEDSEEERLEELYWWGVAYSLLEQSSELANVRLDTSELDSSIQGDSFYYHFFWSIGRALSENTQQTIGKRAARRWEKLISSNLPDLPDDYFTGPAWGAYIEEIVRTIPKILERPEKKRIEIIMKIRDIVKKDVEDIRFKTLEELSPTAMEALLYSRKEAQNERPHNQER